MKKCKHCPVPAAEGRVLCAEHGEARRAQQMEWQRRNKELGLCTSCKSPAVPGITKCQRHRVNAANYRSKVLERTYGIDAEGYERLLAEQGGVCKICKKPETVIGSNGKVKRLAVDHCHDTGRVRGLLCNNCNRGIGLFGDDPAMLIIASRYLMN